MFPTIESPGIAAINQVIDAYLTELPPSPIVYGGLVSATVHTVNNETPPNPCFGALVSDEVLGIVQGPTFVDGLFLL